MISCDEDVASALVLWLVDLRCPPCRSEGKGKPGQAIMVTTLATLIKCSRLEWSIMTMTMTLCGDLGYYRMACSSGHSDEGLYCVLSTPHPPHRRTLSRLATSGKGPLNSMRPAPPKRSGTVLSHTHSPSLTLRVFSSESEYLQQRWLSKAA
jgi:hypothetical protein